MKRFRRIASQRGATQLGLMDIVTAIIVLAILVYAASRQFPTYQSTAAPAAQSSQTP